MKLIERVKANRIQLLYAVIIFFVGILLYHPSLKYEFVGFDDIEIISQNKAYFEKKIDLVDIFTSDAWLKRQSAFYRPLQNLSFAIDTKISGGVDKYWSFHLTSLLLFSFLGVSVFYLFRRFKIPDQWSFMGAIIFVLHPIFVSSASWVPARGDLFLAIFTTWSMYFFSYYVENRKIKNILFTALFFFLALFSKETAISLPLLYLAYFFLFQKKYKIRTKEVVFALAILCLGGIWFYMRNISINVQTVKEGVFWANSSLLIIPTAITQFFLPYYQSTVPLFSLSKSIIGSIIFLFLIYIIFTSNRKTKKEYVFYLFWFLFLLIPTFFFRALIVLDFMEHRFMLPTIGLCLLLLKYFSCKHEKITSKIWMIFGAIALLFFILSWNKQKDYENGKTFFTCAIENGNKHPTMFVNRGMALKEDSDYAAALIDYNKAIELDSNYSESYNGRGLVKYQLGDKEGAMKDLNKAISMHPDIYYLYNRVLVEMRSGNATDALRDCSYAIALDKRNPFTYYQRGMYYKVTGDTKRAINDFQQSLLLDKSNPKAYYELGYAYGLLGQYQAAISCFDNSLRLDNTMDDAYKYRAVAKCKIGNYNSAVTDCMSYLKIHPDDNDALTFLEKVKILAIKCQK